MNVTSSTSSVSSVQSQSKSESSSKTSDTSFEEEMKSASQAEDSAKTSEDSKTTQPKDEKVTEKDSTKDANKLSQELKNPDDIVPEDVFSGGINFTDYKYHNESQSLLSQNIQNLLNTKNIMTTVNSSTLVDYDAINMTDDDANFFANLVQNTDMSMKSISAQIANEIADGSANIQQNIKVSSILMEKLAESMRSNQPFRIDFDKDVSVIIKVNKDGSLTANFIPGDKAVEQYLRNNISLLKQRFDEQNLSYSELSYSNSRREQKQRNSKENKHE